MVLQSLFQWKSHRAVLPLLVSVVVIGSTLLVPTPAHALIFDTLASIVGYIVLLIVSVIGKLITVVIAMLIKIAAYNDFINAPAVTVGWSVLRDLANMVVVVFLLVIALSTILSAPSYEYKQLLPRLLIMAVVVNFSKTIVGIMIDASQIVMLTFVAAFAEAGAGNFVTALNLEKMLALNPEVSQSVSSANIFAGIFLALILMVIALVVLVIMTVIIAFRVIMLWILTVLSPLVFVLSSTQFGKKYYDDWWKQLTNYLIVGPVLAFFIWLTLVSAGGTPGGDSRAVQTFAGGSGTEESTSFFANPADQAFITQAGHMSQLIGFLVAIGMLLGGLMITQQLGVVGSSLAGSALSAGKSYASAALKGGTKLVTGAMKVPLTYGVRKWNEKGLVNPAAMYRGWQASRKQKIDDARGKADAIGREKMERLLSTRLAKDAQGNWKLQKGLAMPHEAAHRASLEARAMKEMDGVPAEKLFKTVEQLYGRKDEDSQTKMRGALRILTRDGKIDDLHGTAFAKNAKWTDENNVEQTGFGNYGRKGGRNMMLALMGAGNVEKAMGSDASVETLDRIGADSEKIGRRELAHLTKWNEDPSKGLVGKSIVQTEADASDHEMSELGKMQLEKAAEIKPHAVAIHEGGKRYAPVLDSDAGTNEARAFAVTVDKAAKSGEKAVIRRMDGRYREMVTGEFDKENNAYVISNDPRSRETAEKLLSDHGDFVHGVEWQNKGAKVVDQTDIDPATGSGRVHDSWTAYAKAKGIKYKYAEPGSKGAAASPLDKKSQNEIVREFTQTIRQNVTDTTKVKDVINVQVEKLKGTVHEENIEVIQHEIERSTPAFIRRRVRLKKVKEGRAGAAEAARGVKQAEAIGKAVKDALDASKTPPPPEPPRIILP